MSYNNYLDCDAAYSAACDLAEPACVIVKHTNPCGVAARPDLREAYRLAVRADPTSAFGGIVAFNRCVAVPGTRMRVQCRYEPMTVSPVPSMPEHASTAGRTRLFSLHSPSRQGSHGHREWIA